MDPALVSAAADRGTARLTDGSAWVIVVSERLRRAGEPPDPNWGTDEVRFDVDECRSAEDARKTLL